MLARTPSTVRLIAAGLTSLGAAAALIANPGGSKAQTLANLETDPARTTYIETRCGPLPKANLECVTINSIEFSRAQTAVAKQVTESAKQGITLEQQLQRCIAFLGEKRANGTVLDRKITRDNVCPYARELGMRDGPG